MLILLLAAAVVLRVLWLNHVMRTTPSEAVKYADKPYTVDRVRGAYDKIQQRPIDFAAARPRRLDRRYIIVGGCGEFTDLWKV